jgi:hypothetical protein
MAVRRCATQGCPGILPAGTGTHCPRCGGTRFVRERRLVRRLLFAGVLALGIVFVVLVLGRHEGMPATGSSSGRRALVEAHEVASRMSATNTRDEAYADIVRRALAQQDYEYACEVGGEMSTSSIKDKCLLDVVEEALKAHQKAWATRAAEEMNNVGDRDAAFKRILNATTEGGGK